MNAFAFSELVKNPGLLRNYSLSELQKLAQRHPYSSVVYSMVALKAHFDDDGNYEHYLNQAAIRIPDRKKLYQLIHSDYEVTEPITEVLEKPLTFDEDFESVLPEKETVEVEDKAAESVPFVEEEISIEDERIEDEREIEKEEIVIEQNTKEVVPPAQEEALAQEEVKVEEVPLIPPQEEIPVEQDSTPNTPPPTLTPPPSIDLPGSDEVLDALTALKGSQKKIEEERKEALIEKINEVILPEKKTEPANDAHSFSEWLSLLTKGAKAEEKPQSKAEEKPLPVEPLFTESLELESAPVLTDEEKEIDEILINKQAKASLTQDDELVTETLAKIYEIQKKFDKAVKAYQILSLKFPDKRAYFADKIEKLKNK